MLAQHRLVKQKQIFGSRKMQLRGVTTGHTGMIMVIPKYSDVLTITINPKKHGGGGMESTHQVQILLVFLQFSSKLIKVV